MTDTEDNILMAAFVNNIEYYRAIYSRMTTATGRPKKVPWYLIVKCDQRGHLTVTNMKRAVGMRFRCSRQGMRIGRGSIVCESRVEIIEVPDMEDRFGLSKEQADEIHETWKGKYA
jgi:hypothetical protein